MPSRSAAWLQDHSDPRTQGTCPKRRTPPPCETILCIGTEKSLQSLNHIAHEPRCHENVSDPHSLTVAACQSALFLKATIELGTFERILYFNRYDIILKRITRRTRNYSVYRLCFIFNNITIFFTLLLSPGPPMVAHARPPC